MKKLSISISLTLALSAGLASAEPFPTDGWSHSGDDTVRCMAIGCDPSDYERYPEYAPPLGQGFGDAPGHGPGYGPGYSQPEAPVELYIPVTPGEHAGYGSHFDPEIGELLEHLPLEPSHGFGEVETAPPPVTEESARDDFYRTLREHANGSGTIEQVEEAYQRLQPFRR